MEKHEKKILETFLELTEKQKKQSMTLKKRKQSFEKKQVRDFFKKFEIGGSDFDKLQQILCDLMKILQSKQLNNLRRRKNLH